MSRGSTIVLDEIRSSSLLPEPGERTAVIAIADGYHEHEFWFPYYRLIEEGFRVVVAGLSTGTVYGEGTICEEGASGSRGLPAVVTHSLDDVTKLDFELLYLPGGLISPLKLRRDQTMLSLVRDAIRGERVVGAICHASWILIDAGVVRGRHLTAPDDMACDVRNAGGLYESEPCVTDGKLVTATFYRYLPEQFRALMALVKTAKYV
jgi:protease I